jgi:outer membrane protein assembly factor BamD
MMKKLCVVVLAVAPLIGCSNRFRPELYAGPQALMDESLSRYRRGDFENAGLGFRRLTLMLPSRDSLAVRARFLLAECQFAQQDFLEAARQFRRVLDEAPGNALGPQALLRAGDAQSELWKRPELDPTYGEAALSTYRELVARFPGTEAAQRATRKLDRLSELFAEKEYKNGVFYQRLKAYDSAILYFKNVVASYGQSSYAADALVQLVQIYARLEYAEERQEICDHIREFYPEERRAEKNCATAAEP